MALSTSSNYPEGTNEFTVERAGYVIGDHQQEFSLSAPPTTGASIFDQTPENIDFRVEATGTTILSNDGQQYSVNFIQQSSFRFWWQLSTNLSGYRRHRYHS